MNKNKLTKILFIIYILLLTWLVVFKLSSVFYYKKFELDLILIPFHYNKPVPIEVHILEVIENIIIFLPIGIFTNQLNKNLKESLKLGFFLSITYEIIELIFRIGTCDITDLMTNTIGTFIGFKLYELINKIIKNKELLNKILRIIELTSLIIIFVIYIIIFFKLKGE